VAIVVFGWGDAINMFGSGVNFQAILKLENVGGHSFSDVCDVCVLFPFFTFRKKN